MSLLFLLAFFLIKLNTASAQENQEIGFSYRNIPVKNQLSSGSFFDLMMKPGQKQALLTEITNTSNEEIVIKVTVSNATTAESGIINYSPSNAKNTDELKPSLKELAKVPKTITIPKGATRNLKIELTMPKEKFAGILLGGIQLEQVITESEDNNKKKDQSFVSSQFAYVYSISLRESKEEQKIELTYLDSQFQSTTEGERVVTRFSNDSAAIVKGMQVEAEITAKNSEKVLISKKTSNLKMAPQSIIDFSMDTKDLEEGQTYKLHMTVTQNGKKWRWVKKITKQSKNQSKSITKQKTIFIAKQPTNRMKVLLYFVGGSIAIWMGTWLLYRVCRKFL